MEKFQNHTFVICAYKESPYLEECIKSVLNQTVKSNIIMSTSTPNEYIENLAKKYNLQLFVNTGKSGIGQDWNFGISNTKTDYVTVAHQDDIYDSNYSKRMVDLYLKYPDANILFSDYYEIRKEEKVSGNTNLRIKRILLFPLRCHKISKFKFIKRWGIRFGNGICCPAVTFVVKSCPKEIFTSDYQCNVDWFAWEKLSRLKGRFIYDQKILMGHRISEESTTTDIIKNGIRTKEDYSIYCKFWPKGIARLFTDLYKNSEKSNQID